MNRCGRFPRSPGHSELIHRSPAAYRRIPLQFAGQHFSSLTTESQGTGGDAPSDVRAHERRSECQHGPRCVSLQGRDVALDHTS